MHRKAAFVVFSIFFFSYVLSTPSNLQPLRRFRQGGLVQDVGESEDCSNWNGVDSCQGSQTDEPADKDNRKWQTTPRGAPYWNETYQDYHNLVGYAQVVYGNLHKTAKVTVKTTTRDPNVVLMYSYNGAAPTSDNTISVDTTLDDPLVIRITGSDGSVLQLDEIYFLWQNEDIKDVPQFKSGQKGAIVELFGWPYDDVAGECETLSKMGYMGVKVYPPQESVISFDQLQSNELNPWWFIYQPTSYRLSGRAGTRQQLRKMIQTCRSFGVRVYADAVVNHMSGNGNDVGTHRTGNGGSCSYWGAKNSTGGSPYFTQGFAYQNNTWTGNHPGQEFPSVPYSPTDFHCERSLSSWSDPFALNYGWLSGLCDLNTEKPYVQQRIADYFTDLLGIGFSGFRFDAAKHIQPDDLSAIFAAMKANLGGNIPDDFMTYLEVLLGGEKDLLMCQYSYYQYSQYFVDSMTKAGLSSSDIGKIKIWSSDYPKEFPICGYWVVPAERLVVENDCVDDQKPGSSSRDMGDKGSVLVIEKNVDKHRNFEVELFTRTDGTWTHKLVLSSYTLRPNTQGNDGWPDGLSDCSKMCQGAYCSQCLGVAYQKAHDPNTCGYTVYDNSGNWASGYYTRVHRDRSIIMAMRAWVGLPTNVSNKDIGLPDACQ